MWANRPHCQSCSSMDTTSGSVTLIKPEISILVRQDGSDVTLVLQGAEKILGMNESGELQDLLMKIEVGLVLCEHQKTHTEPEKLVPNDLNKLAEGAEIKQAKHKLKVKKAKY